MALYVYGQGKLRICYYWFIDVLSEVVISEKVLHSQSVPLPGSEVSLHVKIMSCSFVGKALRHIITNSDCA